VPVGRSRRSTSAASIREAESAFDRTLERAARAALFAFVSACYAILMMAGSDEMGRAVAAPEKETIVIGTRTKPVRLTVEIADTPELQTRGLMFRRRLGRNAGMLFVYPRSQEIRMWMRNTYIALDMVFIRADGTIHRIAEETEPFSEATIASRGNVRAVLEIKGGAARALGIRPGDRVTSRHLPAP